MDLARLANPGYRLYQTFWQALDWLFPPTCGGCQTLGLRWCTGCQQQVARIEPPICPICGEPASGVCARCQAAPPAYSVIRSYGVFSGPLREALHRLKYKDDIGLGEALSKHLIELYNDLNWEVDIIAPVPLSARRLRERGYNQSGLLGRPLAYATRKTYKPGILMRTRETRTQVGLSNKERHQNVEGAFLARADLVGGKSILLIDDVMTTGSTINACAQALRQAGASAVYGLTLARAASPALPASTPRG